MAGTALAGAIDYDALKFLAKTEKDANKFLAEGRTLADKGNKIMHEPKVLNYKEAVKFSRIAGPMLYDVAARLSKKAELSLIPETEGS